MARSHYGRLFSMAVLSFVSMYALMYAMVDRIENVYPNFNQFYMAGLMTAAMIIIEIAIMGSMYEHKKLNFVILAGSVAALAGFWFLIRHQAAISDEQFLKSMIPHHASAILMCNQAPVRDAPIKALCSRIVTGQQAEINQMKQMLGEAKK